MERNGGTKFVARESIGGNNTTSSANTKLRITYQMTLKMNLIQTHRQPNQMQLIMYRQSNQMQQVLQSIPVAQLPKETKIRCQTTMNEWLGNQTNNAQQQTQQRNNPSSSSENDTTSSRAENQQLEMRNQNNNLNLNLPARRSQLTLSFSSEGSHTFKRRRLK